MPVMTLVARAQLWDIVLPQLQMALIANLVRLALLTEDLSYLDRAEQGLQA